MGILTLGISYRRAPIELLERLSFADDDLAKTYRHALDLDAIEEAVILSTCNRVEISASVPSYHAGFLALKRVLTETRGVGADELAEPLYSHWEQDAADHLFAVAAGLDSMVIGETQIHAQVREALRTAEAERAAGPAMRALFHAAGRAGRRARAETSLGAAPDAFVALGADLAAESLGGLPDRHVVVVGAGQMAGLAVKHLHDRGVGSVRVLNRSIEHARALAERTGDGYAALDELSMALASADLVVSATGAAETVIDVHTVHAALADARSIPLVLLDLAVPRDVDPAVGGLDGAMLIDILSIRERLMTRGDETVADIVQAHEIVAEEVRRWVVRRRSDTLAPLIRAVQRRGEDVVRAELARHANRLAGLTPDEREAVGALARGIAAKLLHDPIVGLKEHSEPGSGGAHARLLGELLGIDPDTA
ncbi:MAG: glutamyl-tRNA reductase [Actinomycetota bacterium]